MWVDYFYRFSAEFLIVIIQFMFQRWIKNGTKDSYE